MALNNLSEDYLRVLLKNFSVLGDCSIFIFDENLTKFRRIFPLLYKIPCLIVFYITYTLYVFKIFEGDLAFDDLTYFVSLYLICIQTIVRAVVVTSKKKAIKALILRLGSIWRTTDLSEEQIMKKNAQLKSLNFRYAVFYWIAFFGLWQYLMTPLFETLYRRFVLQQECELLLPVDCVYPFETTKDWFTYLAVYIFQAYFVNQIIRCFLGSETILTTLSSHLSTEFTMLQYDLVNLVPETNGRNCDRSERNEGQSMKNFIQRHQELIRLSEDLDDIFNEMIFTYLGVISIIFSFLLLSTIVSKGAADIMRNLIPLFSGFVSVYSQCFYAEALKEASSSIGDSAYQSLWYKGNKKHQFAIWFIIKRSEQPCCLTALKFKKIDLTTLMSVMSTSWSYFSLASSISQE